MIRIFLSLSFIFFAACSSKPKDVSNAARSEPLPQSQSSMEAKQLAFEQEAPRVVEISFYKKSTVLTVDAKNKLLSLVKEIPPAQKISKVQLISWGDQEYPAEGQKQLPAAQVTLADARNKELTKFLKGQRKNLNFDTHNMAKRPSALGEIWGSSDARIKSSLESLGIATQGKTSERSPSAASKASKAIVMIQFQTVKE